MSHILIETADGIATLWLNRPDLHNAFDDRLIADVTEGLDALANDPAVRVVLLAGKGRSFSAGADLAWMKRMAGYTPAQNEADAMALATMLHRLNVLPKPTIAWVRGTDPAPFLKASTLTFSSVATRSNFSRIAF